MYYPLVFQPYSSKLRLAVFGLFFEPGDSIRQFGQASRPGKLLLKFLQRPRGSPPNNLTAANRLTGKNSGLPANPRTVFDDAAFRQSRLPAKSYITANEN